MEDSTVTTPNTDKNYYYRDFNSSFISYLNSLFEKRSFIGVSQESIKSACALLDPVLFESAMRSRPTTRFDNCTSFQKVQRKIDLIHRRDKKRTRLLTDRLITNERVIDLWTKRVAGFTGVVPIFYNIDVNDLPEIDFDKMLSRHALSYCINNLLEIDQVHQVGAALFSNLLLSDRMIVAETDFSHQRNMVIKYYYRFGSKSAQRRPIIKKNENIFFNKDRVRNTGITSFFSKNLSGIFSEDIGNFIYFDESIGAKRLAAQGFGPRPRYGYFCLVANFEQYECAYILPLYHQVTRDPIITKTSERFFEAVMQYSGLLAHQKVRDSVYRSQLRHTALVQYRHANEAFEYIYQQIQNIVSDFKGDREQLNLRFAKFTDHFKSLGRSLKNQTQNRYGVGGRPATRDQVRKKTASRKLSAAELKGICELEAASITYESRTCRIIWQQLDQCAVFIEDIDSFTAAVREILFNATKYDVTDSGIRARILRGSRSDEAQLSFSNIGPRLTKAELAELPTMGLRGIGAREHSDQGGGQGLAAAFQALLAAGTDPDYDQSSLSKPQVARLTGAYGTRRLRQLDLAYFTIMINMTH